MMKTIKVTPQEFDDDQAAYYNRCIEKIENEDYNDVVEVDFDNIDDELKRLESEGIIWNSQKKPTKLFLKKLSKYSKTNKELLLWNNWKFRNYNQRSIQ